MSLGLGLACSHAPSMFLPAEAWGAVHGRLTKNVPQPVGLARETAEVIDGFITRINSAFELLKSELERYAPDALIIVGDDQREVFGPDLAPTLAVFTGEKVSGSTNIGSAGQSLAENHLTLECATELASELVKELVSGGFDVTTITELDPKGRPEGGLGHAFMRPANRLDVRGLGIPIIPVFLEAYHDPMPSAARCLELGHAIREACEDTSARVAILGSGGLSHDPGGTRAGWIDERLDRWFLNCIADGDVERLRHLFEFDSDTLRGGTGEIRSWLVVAEALNGTPAKVIDYIPSHHAVTGLGFASWVPEAVA